MIKPKLSILKQSIIHCFKRYYLNKILFVKDIFISKYLLIKQFILFISSYSKLYKLN